MKERIQKILAHAGVASRRAVEQMILDGRISVNDRVVTELPVLVDVSKDRISVDGQKIALKGPASAQRHYLVMNKPKGVYTTNVAQGEQKLAIDLLPEDFPDRVYPVGRLDAEATGLLILTNDGDLTNRLTHPRYGVAKTYRAVVDGYFTTETLAQLEKGVYLIDPNTNRGFKARASRIKILHQSKESSVLEITLRENRNKELRRMLAKVGHKVRELTRTRIGKLVLHGLAPGEFRNLTRDEVRQLRASPAGEAAPRRRRESNNER